VEAGRRIGKYVLDERIAVGGMAEVWAAHAEGREGFVKPVALKFILESFAGDPELERLFVNEARIAARLQHANLVTVFDFDKVDAAEERGIAGRYYIAMERVDGRDLRHILEAAWRAGRAVPTGLALYVAGEILKALRYVHGKREGGVALGLVHRDVSPHNVLVGAAGEVKLSDFGIAKARSHSARNTEPGSMRGKIAYASPEQLSGAVVDHRTDQFAAGATIWELLAGRRLFDGDSELEIIGKVARCEIPPLGDRVAPAVEAVVRRMLAADARARFATTADALTAVLALPGYSPDGAPLGELLRALFPSAAFRSTTLPLGQAGVAELALAPTRTMESATPSPASAATRSRVPRGGGGPSEAPLGDPNTAGTTTDVRPRGGAVKWLGALVVAGAVVAGVLARGQLGLGRAPAAPAPAPPVVASPAPAPRPVAPPPAAPAPPPVSAAPAAPPVAAAPSAAVEQTTTHAARATRVEHRRSERHAPAAHERASAPAAAPAPPPAASPPPPVRKSEPPSPAKKSANGAPIIE